EPASSCSTGPIQCCDSSATAGDPAASAVLSLVGAVVQDLNVGVGLTCSPITVVGTSGGTCSGEALCCENSSFGGLIALGCVPVTL
ncbi:hydrophobin, partial [Mycena epipterygia]